MRKLTSFCTIFLLLLAIVHGKPFKFEKPHLFSCPPQENYDKSVWHCGNSFFSHHSSRIIAMLTFDKKSINYCCAEFSYHTTCRIEKTEIHWSFQQCLQSRGNFITRNLIGPLMSNLAMVFG